MTFHSRNRHQGRYNFKQLTQACPELSPFLITTPVHEHSIDFANPLAVKTLNRALLQLYYGVKNWDIPDNYLCPPIPGRADYIHSAADLLSSGSGGIIPRGDSIRVLDIGVGANCIFPILGHCEYGWSFLGSDIDPVALASAKRIVESNPSLKGTIQLRQQPSAQFIFKGLLQPHERFHLSICNPPFHASLAEAREGTRRKWKNLGKGRSNRLPPVLNFGGQGAELWCPGGELAFIVRMIQESSQISNQCHWFTTLVSNSSHLREIDQAFRKAKVVESRTIAMEQGQKKTRLVAWTYQKSHSFETSELTQAKLR
jgi:23S rRNA (adenine1618-N6)-methyltransferase